MGRRRGFAKAIDADDVAIEAGIGAPECAHGPELAARLHERAPNVVLRIVPSGVPSLESLRADACQLIISPRPPDATEVMQKRLFEDRYSVFYDATRREPPKTRAEYLAAEHATVVYELCRGLDLDQHLAARGIERRFRVTVPGCSALPAFIRGTRLIATAPGLLIRRTMTGPGQCRPPVPCPNLSNFMIWHARYQQDPARMWLREQLLAWVPDALAEVQATVEGR